MKTDIEKFKREYYTGRIIRHNGERKVIARAFINNLEETCIVFVDGKKCFNLKEIELDGRK
jgi:hypothetical protein